MILLSAPQYHFSISHTNYFILSYISNQTPVGADVELIQKAPLEIMDICFHPVEKKYVLNTSSDMQSLLFYKIWTQKEAYTKFLGTGLVENLTAINTLDPQYHSNFYTWQHHHYICSIFSKTIAFPSINDISEYDLVQYYLNSNQIHQESIGL